MKIYYTDIFVLPLPAGHHFPMKKYRMLKDRILELGDIYPLDFSVPRPATDDEITCAHDPEYLAKIVSGNLTDKELRRLGLPWSKQLVERSRRSCGATIEACLAALAHGMAINLAGGTHHAFSDHGEGYCVFNDAAIAARLMVIREHARKVLILDCDVHQGNGTAAILCRDDNIFTFSIHGRKNFPHNKETSDLDISLEDDTTDNDYLDQLKAGLDAVLDRFIPELVIYLAGADPYYLDKFGRLALTREALINRDRLVFDFCRKRSLPIAVTMAGGYAGKVDDTVDIHYQTVRQALHILYGQSCQAEN